MGDDGMDEDDSFYKPVPFSAPYVKPSTQLQPVNEKNGSDPDSDDSFDNFPATQSTASASAKSTASSTQSAESKIPPVRKPVFPSSFKSQQLFDARPRPPTFSQLSTQKVGGPSGLPPKAHNIPVVYPAVKRTSGVAQRSSAATPCSPNSLARHRSANSGLRNSHVNTPPVRANIFAPKLSPNEARPATPSGEVKMLTDMLDKERLTIQRMQNDFRNDTAKNAEKHRLELAHRDKIIKEKEGQIAMLQTTNGCTAKHASSSSSKPPRIQTKSPVIPIPIIPNFPPSCSKPEVRKVYPKLPTNLKRTPHRQVRFPASTISAFRHAAKSEDEDTFQLDASFEPSATSTPKFGGPIRMTVRRPLSLDEPLEEVNRGAPTAKKKPRVLRLRRTLKSREEMEEMAEREWKKMEGSESAFQKLYPRAGKETVKNIRDGLNWIDEHLSEKVRYLDLKKEENEPMSTAKARAKLMQQAELVVQPDMICKICGVDDQAVSKHRENENKEKEWETKETERVNLAKRGAEELRNRQYSELMLSVHRKGIEGFESVSQMKSLVEGQYKEKTSRIHRRTLNEKREEKRELWRETMMDELRRNGDLDADLDVLDEGRREDYLWTSESEDEDWQFPEPYNKQKRSLCKDCADRQRIQRRVTKRERERRKLKKICVKEYGVERREQLRNISVLTKSTMEAAENELNRHVDEVLASSHFTEDEDEF